MIEARKHMPQENGKSIFIFVQLLKYNYKVLIKYFYFLNIDILILWLFFYQYSKLVVNNRFNSCAWNHHLNATHLYFVYLLQNIPQINNEAPNELPDYFLSSQQFWFLLSKKDIVNKKVFLTK